MSRLWGNMGTCLTKSAVSSGHRSRLFFHERHPTQAHSHSMLQDFSLAAFGSHSDCSARSFTTSYNRYIFTSLLRYLAFFSNLRALIRTNSKISLHKNFQFNNRPAFLYHPFTVQRGNAGVPLCTRRDHRNLPLPPLRPIQKRARVRITTPITTAFSIASPY